MLSVIGLEASIASIKGIDAIDYHLYTQQLINLDDIEIAFTKPEQLFEEIHTDIAEILTLLSLQFCELPLLVVGADLDAYFSKAKQISHVQQCADYIQALVSANQLADQGAPIFVLCVDNSTASYTLLLVCDKQQLDQRYQFLQQTHVYAEYSSYSTPLSNYKQHLHAFIEANKLDVTSLDSLLFTRADKQTVPDAWLKAFDELNETKSSGNSLNSCEQASTLLSQLPYLSKASADFNAGFGHIASMLCIDQGYRLGSDYIIDTQIPVTQGYYLSSSTSYLPNQGQESRTLIYSCKLESAYLSIQCKTAPTQCVKQIENGFLAQQTLKPVIYFAADKDSLVNALEIASKKIRDGAINNQGNLRCYAASQYQLFANHSLNKYLCIVFVVSSVDHLEQQMLLALSHLTDNNKSNSVWKTPSGSYFSGRKVSCEEQRLVSFVYPGIGSLYLDIGKDLLRLFPASYQHLLSITKDLGNSLQDKLITPRYNKTIKAKDKLAAEQMLRADLANIAEAGVSYACLLTSIFQHQLCVQPTSAAGYSMGEVSMFAALDCWENASVMSRRLRENPVFATQLSGPLLSLDDTWQGEALADNKRWDSFHIKAGIVQVESLLAGFPRVFITIINTPQSMVIAGSPKQCHALASRLGVRAISVDIQNIIHCEMAKSQYKNMQDLYSLPIKEPRPTIRFFSSSCYLPVPVSEKAIAVSISKCLTEQVDFPRLITAMADSGESVFIEMGAGKALTSWIEKVLKGQTSAVTCLSVNQKNIDDHSAILKVIAALLTLGHRINLQPYFSGTLKRTLVIR